MGEGAVRASRQLVSGAAHVEDGKKWGNEDVEFIVSLLPWTGSTNVNYKLLLLRSCVS